MRFALLGDHPDGLDLARALEATGRHSVTTYSGHAAGGETLRRAGLAPRPVRDLEEILADPAVEAVVVASRPDVRAQHLRRALQSERHILCVHPADRTPDAAYEAAMIQSDTRCVLLPLLAESLHPGVLRLAELARDPGRPLGELVLLDIERRSTDTVALEAGPAEQRVSLPGWDVLRRIGGEISEVSALAVQEAMDAEQPVVVTGRFERGLLFRATFLPRMREADQRLTLVGSSGWAELNFATGWPGPASLRWKDAGGQEHQEAYEAWDPWQPLIEVFEAAVARTNTSSPVSWQTAVRCQELDDGVRRSVERRRASTLDYQEASEEVGFKGTMTLLGCGMLWLIILLVILSRWVPWLGWLIVPILVVFLGLQALRWIVFRRRAEAQGGRERPGQE